MSGRRKSSIAAKSFFTVPLRSAGSVKQAVVAHNSTNTGYHSPARPGWVGNGSNPEEPPLPASDPFECSAASSRRHSSSEEADPPKAIPSRRHTTVPAEGDGLRRMAPCTKLETPCFVFSFLGSIKSTDILPSLILYTEARSIAAPKQQQMPLRVTFCMRVCVADRVKVVVRLRPAHDGESGGAMQVSEDGKDIQLLRK